MGYLGLRHYGLQRGVGRVKAAAKKFEETQEHYFTLVLFDSASIDEVYWNARIGDAAILTEETYVPGASTPLYDAMGRTFSKLEKQLKGEENYSVVVTVITDGYENSSSEYNLVSVKKMIEHLKKQGWSFAYMGTDHDVEGVTVGLSITNVIKFDKTAEDTLETFKRERRARERYLMEIDDFNHAMPGATEVDRVKFNATLASKYYEEEQD